MRIGILGSGRMGAKLGTLFAQAGHEVIFSYSRDQKKLQRLARRAGHGARAGTVRAAVQESDVLLLSVHWSSINDVLKQAGALSGKTVITCCLPMSDDDTRLMVAHSTSGAEALARKVPKARVVGAFGTVPSEVLFDVYASRKRKTRPSLVYYGDHKAAKRLAARLIRDVGFDPVDAGPLSIARYAEPFTLLIAELAYEGKRGPRLAYRFERFAG